MKKKNLLIVLAVISLLLFSVTANAQEQITIFVNGNVLQSDVPPQIINDRTMVPIRAVAEALDCEVTWNQNGTIAINKKPPSETANTPIVKGDAEFANIINGSLMLLKEKDIDTYNLICTNIEMILYLDNDSQQMLKQEGLSNSIAFNKLNHIFINKSYFDQFLTSNTEHEVTLFYAGILVHELTHSTILKGQLDKQFPVLDQETICSLAALRSLDKIGAKDSRVYRVFRLGIERDLKL